MGILTRLLINALALWLTVLLGQKLGFDLRITGDLNRAVAATLVMVVALAGVNAFIKPVVKFVAAPLNCLTLGLLTFVINALLFLLASAITRRLGYGFVVGGFWAGLFGSVVMGAISSLATSLVADPGKDK